jgi:hypothetical protein
MAEMSFLALAYIAWKLSNINDCLNEIEKMLSGNPEKEGG